MEHSMRLHIHLYIGGNNTADKYKVAPYPAGYFTAATAAMHAIIMERRIELAEEGHRFFDLRDGRLLGNPILARLII